MELVRARLRGWQTRFLSVRGHLVLLRSVMSLIPVYHMTVNVLLEGVK